LNRWLLTTYAWRAKVAAASNRIGAALKKASSIDDLKNNLAA